MSAALLPSGIFSSLRSSASRLGSGGTTGVLDSTGRNSSWAVRPTSSKARSWSSMPGSWMRILLPCELISGSDTPRVSMRLRMIAIACSTCSSLTSSAGLPSTYGSSTTEMPP
jgi:hypothetical protein